MNSLVVRNEIQEKINNNQSIVGMKVFRVCGGFVHHEGVVRELSIYDHRLLGVLHQVWVEWFNTEGGEDICPYDPKQMKKWQGSSAKMGVYYEY